MSSKNNGEKNAGKNNPNSNVEPVVTDFGMRAISTQNFSKMVALPKTALSNCCSEDADEVNVQLVQQNGERFLKLTPICSTKKKGGGESKK